ncbi:MAG: hypothetical protein OEY59_01480 [Deltaproteobacteria bacterium]|nr:hypothetical protein [Deltaproteobacteria bacterium]
MTRNDEMKEVLTNSAFQLGNGIRNLLIVLMAIGVIGFIVGLVSGHSGLAWRALLINTILFGGISTGGLMFSVIMTVTEANWGRPIKRLAESMASFTPFAGILFIILFFGGHHFFEWMDHDKVIHSKAGWLSYPFFVERNVILFIIFMILGWFYLKASVRPDVGLAKRLTQFGNNFANRFIKNYGDQEEEELQSIRITRRLAPFVGIAFALLSTLIAFDWMMSIDQEWFSTMFGVQYAIANMIGALAMLMIFSGFARSRLRLEDYISVNRYHDVSKLGFSACALWTYLIFSQVLVIWYGNLPEETPYVILRMQSHEWGWVFWLIMVLLFIIPFFGLMSRTSSNSVWFSRIIAIDILVGVWLEKYFLIVPSIQENLAAAGHGAAEHGLPGFEYNLYDFAITLGVLGGFLFCALWFLQRIPVVPISDKRFFQVSHH